MDCCGLSLSSVLDGPMPLPPRDRCWDCVFLGVVKFERDIKEKTLYLPSRCPRLWLGCPFPPHDSAHSFLEECLCRRRASASHFVLTIGLRYCSSPSFFSCSGEHPKANLPNGAKLFTSFFFLLDKWLLCKCLWPLSHHQPAT